VALTPEVTGDRFFPVTCDLIPQAAVVDKKNEEKSE